MSHYKIWHICWEFPPSITGGLAVACAAIAKALDPDVDQQVITPQSLGCTEVGYGSAYASGYPCSLKGLYTLDDLFHWLDTAEIPNDVDGLWAAVLKFSCLVRQLEVGEDCLIVHAHDWMSLLAGLALRKNSAVRVIYHVHSTQIDRVGAHSADLIYKLEQWGMKEADSVVFVSEMSRQSAVEFYALDPAKSQVILNASDREHKSSTMGDRVLFLGRLTSQKAPATMLEIARRLIATREGIKVYFAGDGDQLKKLRAVVEFCQLQDVITFLGHVPHDQIGELLQRVRVLCLPSVAEPFGLVALEAAARSIPVVMSDRCGAAEVLVSAKCIHHQNIDDWCNALGTLLDDSSEAQRYGAVLQKEAASRTWQDAANELLDLYRQLSC